MTITPVSPQLQRVATTGLAGFALQNGTPTILSWTAPNDGQMHRAFLFVSESCTVAETGGSITWGFTPPTGVAKTGINVLAAGQAVGTYHFQDGCILGAGQTVSIVQGSALTAGAMLVWAEIWAD